MMWIALLLACSNREAAPVRVTLADAQVLVGAVQTDMLELETALGVLEIPLKDVGEVVPVEGAHLKASNAHVTVWLRNGSELRGRWAEPELSVAIQIGGQPHNVELPVDQLARMQTPGQLAWPTGTIFRVQTTHGDDLLVDAAKTQVTIANSMGTFSPYLEECTALEPLGDPEGDWRITLRSGTVLVGALQHDSLHLALPLGPPSVDVPVRYLKKLSWQQWGEQSQYAPSSAVEIESAEWFSSGSAAAAKRVH